MAKNYPLRVSEISINRPLTHSRTLTPTLLHPPRPHHVDRDRRKSWTFEARNKITRTKNNRI